MSTAGGSDLLETLGVAPTSPVAGVDVDAASDVDGAEGADEVKYDEAESMVMVGGADALELAYHAARDGSRDAQWRGDCSLHEQILKILSKFFHILFLF